MYARYNTITQGLYRHTNTNSTSCIHVQPQQVYVHNLQWSTIPVPSISVRSLRRIHEHMHIIPVDLRASCPKRMSCGGFRRKFLLPKKNGPVPQVQSYHTVGKHSKKHQKSTHGVQGIITEKMGILPSKILSESSKPVCSVLRRGMYSSFHYFNKRG